MQTTRRSFLAFLGAAALAGCPRPNPAPDGGGVTPSGPLAVIGTITDVLGTVVPILVPFFRRFIPDGVAKAVVLGAAEVVARIANEWQAVAATYRERGGESCQLYAVTGALIDALVRLARALVDAGFGWGDEIATLIDDLGLLLDRLIGRCAEDGGVDAGPLAATGSAGDAARATLAQLRDGARARGVGLRALPPLHPSSL